MKTLHTFSRGLVLILLIGISMVSAHLLKSPPPPLMGGTYTIGGSNPDFTSFTEAVDSLSANGISGPIVFEVRSDTFHEQVVIPEIVGASATNTITFRSESGDSTDVVLSYASTLSYQNYVLKLDGCDYARFENMTFHPVGATYSRGVQLANRANNNVFEHCQFVGQVVSGSNSNASLVMVGTSSQLSEFNQFSHNRFENGSYGIWASGYSTSLRASGWQIDNNQFALPSYRGIHLQSMDSVQILANQIHITQNIGEGIYLLDCRSPVQIAKNQILVPNGDGLIINGIRPLSSTQITIANNFIEAGTYGFLAANSDGYDFLHNSILISGTNTGSRGILLNNSVSDVRILNNVTNNQAGGLAMYSNTRPNFYPLEMDYNSYFTTGTQFGYWSGAIADFTTWKNTTGEDQHAIYYDPAFVNNDLHVPATSIGLNAAGIYLPEVPEDIDGEMRLNPPDIGADEFAVLGANAKLKEIIIPKGLFPAGTYPLQIVIQNTAADTLVNYQLIWSLNGATQPLITRSGPLASLERDTVDLGQFPFSVGTIYQVDARVQLPLPQVDLAAFDDTLSSPLFAPALSGTYTLGGITPDFQDFNHIAEAAGIGGILDTVIMLVRAATYTEQVTFPSIPNADCSRPIIFEGETGDSTDVVLTYGNATSTTNFVVNINGAKGLTFRHLTLQNTTTNYARVIVLGDSSDCIQVERCRLIGVGNATSTARAIFYSTNGSHKSVRLQQNRIESGSFGMYHYTPGTDARVELIDNDWIDQYNRTFYSLYAGSHLITGNYVETNSTYNTFIGMFVDLAWDTVIISRNQIIANENYALEVRKNYGYVRVENNFLTVLGNGASAALYLEDVTDIDVFHNNLLVKSTHATLGQALLEDLGSRNVNLYNNVIVNEGAGYAVRMGGQAVFAASDHNDFYSKGTVLMQTDGNSFADLSAWQMTTNLDSASISVDPEYLSDTDLHVQKARLNAAGKAGLAVSVDFDGELRNSPPDIGADEFIATGADVALVEVLYPQAPFDTGTYALGAVISNQGPNVLDSVKIGWKRNGLLQPDFPVSLALPVGKKDTIWFANQHFQALSLYDLQVFTYQPNGLTDAFPNDDSLAVNNLLAAFSGDYTVGGTSPDLPDITTTALWLSYGGVLDSARFLLRSGTYQERVTFNSYPGMGCDRPVTITSEAAHQDSVTWQFNANSSSNFNVSLSGVSGMIFRDLTFQRLNGIYTRLMEIQDGSHCNQVLNNHFIGLSTTSSNSRYALVFSPTSNGPFAGDTANVFRNNHFQWGSHGIVMQGYNSNNFERGTVIENNFFDDQGFRGIAANHQRGPRIIGNEFKTLTSNNSYIGISLYQGGRTAIVAKNKLDLIQGEGIYLNDFSAQVGDSGLIANNFIHIGGTGTSRGILLLNSHRHRVYYNNVNLQSSHTANGRAFQSSGSNGVKALNNVFVNGGGGYAMYVTTSNGFISNYNDLFATGTNLGYDGSAISDLAAWQTATGQDGNSISLNPNYISNADLHVQEAGLNGKATPLAEVTDDIDGETRDAAKPDIGADEFFPPVSDDASVTAFLGPKRPFAAGVQSIWIEVANGGADTLKTLQLAWEVNGTAQTTFSFAGAIPSGEKDTLNIGTYAFNIDTEYDLIIWSQLPNGGVDPINANDSLEENDLYVALGGTYTIGGASPDFLNFNAAVTNFSKGGLLDSVTFLVRDSVYHEKVMIDPVLESDSQHVITFQGESGDSSLVTLTHGGVNGASLVLIGTSYIHFRDMTFERTSGGTSSVHAVVLNNPTDHINFENCRFIGVTTTSTSDQYSTLRAISSQYHDMVFHQNTFWEGSRGLNFESNGHHLSIKNNIFENQSFAGMYIRYMDTVSIERNQTFAPISPAANYRGIHFADANGGLSFRKNRANAGVGKWGIVFSYTSGFIHPVSNNYAYVGGSDDGGGMYIGYVWNADFEHNSIHYASSNASGQAVYILGGNFNSFRNNIFATLGSGLAIFVTANGPYGVGNYNNLYTQGSVLGKWVNTDYVTFSAWQTGTSKDANSVSVDPLFAAAGDPHISAVALDSAGIYRSGVPDDIDDEIRHNRPDIGCDEFSTISRDVAVTDILRPTSDCGLGQDSVEVKIANLSGQPHWNFSVSYRLDSTTVVNETFTDTLNPGQSARFTFAATADLSAIGWHTIDSWTSLAGDQRPLNDTLGGYPVLNTPVATAPANFMPGDSTKDVVTPITFSWSGDSTVVNYDFYLWPASSTKPATPTQSALTDTTYTRTSALTAGVYYHWQVVANNACSQTAGPVTVFETRPLPNLVADTVLAPLTAFSGQNITVSWVIKNAGGFTTGNKTWTDVVYLSADTILDFNGDVYLGGEFNLSNLSPGGQYTHTQTYAIPKSLVGDHYLFVYTDRFNQVKETTTADNKGRQIDTLKIQLTPPPDLQVTSVIAPFNAFSNQQINVTWTVKNEGTGPSLSGRWYDKVYLSQDPALVVRNATQLGRFKRTGNLQADSSYTKTQQITLPNGIFGRYYIHVRADADGHEFEYVYENNNDGTSDSMRVTLSPPIDLVVDSVWMADSVSNRDQVIVYWRIRNQGAGNVTGGWYDQLYFTAAADSNLAGATKMGRPFTGINLGPGVTINRSRTVTIPANIQGPYYLYVDTDDGNRVYEYVFEGNNLGRTLFSTEVLNPDMQVSGFSLPDTATAGAFAILGWDIFNAGPAKLTGSTWQDEVMLSRHPVFDPDSVVQLGLPSSGGLILAGDTVSISRNFLLPNGLSGLYYCYVRTDYGSRIFEGAGETNNLSRSVKQIYINLPAWPDLRLTQMIHPDSILAGDSIAFSYQMKNLGPADISGRIWRDKLYFQLDSVFDVNTASQLKEITRAVQLEKDSSYRINLNFPMPLLNSMAGGQGLNIADGYFFVQADAADNLYEHTGEANNLAKSTKVHITEATRSDLWVPTLSLPGFSFNSGQQTQLSWQVANQGASTSLWKQYSWHDGIYISADTVWDSGDSLVLKNLWRNGLSKGAMYSAQANFTIPNGYSGTYYLFLVANYASNLLESDRTNNYALLRQNNGMPQPLTITLTPSPDLIVTSLTAPATGTAGQPLDFSWRVENQGIGPAAGSGWLDRSYLSRDQILDGTDLNLGGKSHNGALTVSQYYADSTSQNVPLTASGNYYLLLSTDDDDRIYEHLAENNNVASSPIFIDQPLPSDLIVSSINVPDSVFVGELTAISWTLENQGANPANGRISEAVYLSKDTLWDAGDQLIANLRPRINIPPSASLNRQLSVRFTPDQLAPYYVIVRTDIGNNLPESDETNNTGFSNDPVDMVVYRLPLAQSQGDTLLDLIPVYYRIDIPDSLAGEDLLVRLQGDSTRGTSELYMRYGALANRTIHDYSSIQPYRSRQEVVISQIQKGTYYLMAYGDNRNNLIQEISLWAEILPFSVRSVDAKKGGNTGSVTVRIDGSKFLPSTEFMLADSGRVIQSSRIYYQSRTYVFATFDLRGADLGFYDVIAVNGLDTTALKDGFEVEIGSLGAGIGQGSSVGSGSGSSGGGISCTIDNVGYGSQLAVWISAASQTRAGRVEPITIHYRNQGNVDIPAPTRPLISLEGAPLAFTVPDLAKKETELLIEMVDSNGPPGIIRPGGGGSVTVYTKAIAVMWFRLLL